MAVQDINHPTISVCIANYNGIGVIEACIASVKAQAIDLAIEIIVHDDASSDDSIEYIRNHYPDVNLIQSMENVGFCIANNRMVDVARGKYILLLNNDAELYPDALNALYSKAEQISRAAILSLPQHDAASGDLIDIGSLFDPFLNPIPNKDPKRNVVGMVMGACLWIPKNLWNELGGFPEWFGSIGEDLFLCCRARMNGHPVLALDVSGYRHHVGASFGGGKVQNNELTTTFRRRALSERNKTFVMAMTYPPPFMQIILPIHMALLLTEGLLLSILKGKYSFLREIYLPVFVSIYQKRRLLLTGRSIAMASRRLSSADFFSVFDCLPYKLRMLVKHGLPKVD